MGLTGALHVQSCFKVGFFLTPDLFSYFLYVISAGGGGGGGGGTEDYIK